MSTNDKIILSVTPANVRSIGVDKTAKCVRENVRTIPAVKAVSVSMTQISPISIDAFASRVTKTT